MDLVRCFLVCDAAKMLVHLVRLMVSRILSGCSPSLHPSCEWCDQCQTVSGLVGVGDCMLRVENDARL